MLWPFFMPLFTRVRGRGILRSSLPARSKTGPWGMRRLAAFVTVCTNAPVGMRVGKGEEKACDEWRLH